MVKTVNKHNNHCIVCDKSFDKPDTDLACGEEVCPFCGVHLPQSTYIYVIDEE